MKNYLIITIGTRDVQLRRDLIMQSDDWSVQQVKDEKTGREQTIIERNGQRLPVHTSTDFPDYYTISPRKGGQQIAKNIRLYRNVLELPLITPVVDQLQQENKPINTVLLIYTNQQQEFDEGKIKPYHYQNDTLNLSEIIEVVLREHPLLTQADFDHYEIFHRVADIDFQYDQFATKNHSLFDDPESVKTICLLPQGGIDQINQAITLQLIQAFKHKVKLYQKPDGTNPVILNFTNQFLDDLNKQKILKHLEDYDFGYIDKSLSSNKAVCNLAQYAARRLALQHNQVSNNVEALINNNSLNNLWPLFKQQIDTEDSKLVDLYLSAKISCKQKKYNEFLWKIFTLNETLFRIKAEAIIGNTTSYRIAGLGFSDVNPAWLDKLNRVDQRLVPYLENAGIGLSNPYRKAYFGIYTYLSDSLESLTLYTRVADKLELLADKRHGLAHRLGTTSLNELNQALGNDYKIEGLLADLDKIFTITGFGIYDTIAAEIKNLL